MGSTAGRSRLFLSRNNLGDQSSQERRRHGFRNPLQPRIVGKRLLPHESMKFRKCDSVTEQRGVFLPQSRERRQIGVFWRRRVPPCPNLRERMFGCRSPEYALTSEVVCNERMLQTKPICNRTNARAFESSFGKLRNGSVQDRVTRFKRALLFGSLTRTPPPLHGRSQLCALRHVHLLTRLQRDADSVMRLRLLRRLVAGSDEAGRPSTSKVQFLGKPEIIFDGADAPF